MNCIGLMRPNKSFALAFQAAVHLPGSARQSQRLCDRCHDSDVFIGHADATANSREDSSGYTSDRGCHLSECRGCFWPVEQHINNGPQGTLETNSATLFRVMASLTIVCDNAKDRQLGDRISHFSWERIWRQKTQAAQIHLSFHFQAASDSF
jgi:hypothetical protein